MKTVAVRLTLAVATLVVVVGVARAQQYPPYGSPSPGYGTPQPDATNNAGYGDRRYNDRRYDYRSREPEATVFVDDDFRGRSLTLNHGIRRLGQSGFEDKISSIGIRTGVWLVCSDDDFRGRCVTLDRSVGRLSAIGMEDNISSIRPLRRGDR